MISRPKYLFASLALVFLFFVFPQSESNQSYSIESMVLLLVASLGILLSRIFVLSSNDRYKTGIEPAVLACVAAWNCSSLIYPLTILLTFSGSILNALRMEEQLKSTLRRALFQSISYAFLLKLSSFIYWHFLSSWTARGAIHTYLGLVAIVLMVILLRTIAVSFADKSPGKFIELLKKNIFLNIFILLLAVPGAVQIQRDIISFDTLLYCSFSIFSMLILHGINLKLNRAAHEKTDEFETVLRLKELSGDLFSAASEVNAIRTLTRSLSKAWGCRTAVGWKALKYFDGSAWDTDRAVFIEHHNTGLKIWIDSFSSTIPVYLESFLNRAVPVLTGLEAEKKMRKASWESMETMISFVEQNNSDFAGFSRRTAKTATSLSIALDMDSWFIDCLRLAGLLHMLSQEENDDQSYQVHPHALPEITQEALEFMKEHWSGTGPGGLLKDSIPLPARILAVSIAWEKAINLGTAIAVRDMNMKAGTLYDPRLAKLVIQLNS